MCPAQARERGSSELQGAPSAGPQPRAFPLLWAALPDLLLPPFPLSPLTPLFPPSLLCLLPSFFFLPLLLRFWSSSNCLLPLFFSHFLSHFCSLLLALPSSSYKESPPTPTWFFLGARTAFHVPTNFPSEPNTLVQTQSVWVPMSHSEVGHGKEVAEL